MVLQQVPLFYCIVQCLFIWCLGNTVLRDCGLSCLTSLISLVFNLFRTTKSNPCLKWHRIPLSYWWFSHQWRCIESHKTVNTVVICVDSDYPAQVCNTHYLCYSPAYLLQFWESVFEQNILAHMFVSWSKPLAYDHQILSFLHNNGRWQNWFLSFGLIQQGKYWWYFPRKKDLAFHANCANCLH